MNSLLESPATGLFVAVGLLLVLGFQASLYWAASTTPELPSKSRPWLNRLAMFLIAPAVCALYLAQGSPSSLNSIQPTAQHDADMQRSVKRLEDRLRSAPKDEEGWLMLARSQTALGHYQTAAEAYKNAKPLVWNKPALLIAWAEVQLLAHDRQFDETAYAVINRAWALDPDNPEVLLLHSLACLDRGDHQAARAALQSLRLHYPAGSPDLEAVDAAIQAMEKGN